MERPSVVEIIVLLLIDKLNVELSELEDVDMIIELKAGGKEMGEPSGDTRETLAGR